MTEGLVRRGDMLASRQTGGSTNAISQIQECKSHTLSFSNLFNDDGCQTRDIATPRTSTTCPQLQAPPLHVFSAHIWVVDRGLELASSAEREKDPPQKPQIDSDRSWGRANYKA